MFEMAYFLLFLQHVYCTQCAKDHVLQAIQGPWSILPFPVQWMNRNYCQKHCHYLFRLPKVDIFTFSFSFLFFNGKITFSFWSGRLQSTYKQWGHVTFMFRLKPTVLCTVYTVQFLINSKLVFHSEHSCGLLGKKNKQPSFKPFDYIRRTT